MDDLVLRPVRVVWVFCTAVCVGMFAFSWYAFFVKVPADLPVVLG